MYLLHKHTYTHICTDTCCFIHTQKHTYKKISIYKRWTNLYIFVLYTHTHTHTHTDTHTHTHTPRSRPCGGLCRNRSCVTHHVLGPGMHMRECVCVCVCVCVRRPLCGVQSAGPCPHDSLGSCSTRARVPPPPSAIHGRPHPGAAPPLHLSFVF